MPRPSWKDLKAEHTSALEELNQLRTKMRHMHREMGSMLLDLPTPADRAGEPEPITDEVTQAAAAAMERAEAEWLLDVTEPGLGGAHGADRIDEYIRGDEGLGWPDADLKKDGRQPYTRNGQFAWCGAFAAYAWGSTLNASIRKSTFPSTYRLWRDWQSRRVPVASMRPGDIVVIFNASATDEDKKRKPYGQHITLCRQPGPSSYVTLEGNARAAGPDGRLREGVGTREREHSSIAVVYRPQATDLA